MTTAIPDKPRFRPDEVAAILHVSVRSVQRWCKEGRLPSERLTAGVLRIPRPALVDFLRRSQED
jgi:excisionase family DNA binding protein